MRKHPLLISTYGGIYVCLLVEVASESHYYLVTVVTGLVERRRGQSAHFLFTTAVFPKKHTQHEGRTHPKHTIRMNSLGWKRLINRLNVCYRLCLTAATRSGPENMENRLSPLAEDVSSLELAESPWLADQPLLTASLLENKHRYQHTELLTAIFTLPVQS